jgi:hypothetical protein
MYGLVWFDLVSGGVPRCAPYIFRRYKVVTATKKTAELKVAYDATQLSNGGANTIEEGIPYRVTVRVVGTAPILFHAWNTENVREKAAAPKGSAAKKTDNLELSVYRTNDGLMGVPGTMLAAALVQAGRYKQDPRSPRKSAMDLIKAGIVPLTLVAPFEPKAKTWDYEDARRVVIQRASITRIRPAMREGWTCTFDLMITLPEYISAVLVTSLLNDAGRLCGLGDFRPTFGRFAIGELRFGAI